MSTFKKILTACLSTAVITSGITIPADAAAGDAVTALSKDGVAFRFALIGDSHVNASGQNLEYFTDAVKTLNTVGGIDAYGLNGDIILYTTSVTETPYDSINTVLSENGISNTTDDATPYIYAMGNHEFIQNDNDTTTCATAVSMFNTKMGQELNCHKEYNGYHVIASGGQSYNCQWSAGDYNTNETWIMNEIKAIEAETDYSADEPIFLMLHHPIIDSTLRGLKTIDRRYTADFVNFLSERPNIVQLTAHQHYSAMYPQTICQDLGFTSFQTPLTSTSGSSVHQASFIDVTTDNKVKIYKIDLTSNTYIGEPWVIDIPAGANGFKYTDAVRAGNTQAPVFADNAAIEVSDIENYSATITYPTGTVEAMNDQQDNLVRSHRVTVTDTESKEVISTTSYGASFSTVPQPTTLSRTISDLDAGTTYTVSVEPMSMFGVYGKAITAEFTTSGEKSEITVDDTAVKLTYDASLIGETVDSATSYDSLKDSYSAVLIRKGDYFTYTLTVGEGEQIEEPGMYRLTYNYGSESESTVAVSVKWPDATSYTETASGTTLPAGSAYTTLRAYESTDYIQLREGANIIKISLSDISKTNDGVYMGMPSLSKVTSGGYIDYGINTSVYNPVTSTNGTGTGSFTSDISSTTYQTSTMLTFRNGDYVVLPVQVPYTAAYSLDLTAKSTKSLSSNVFKAAYSTTSLDDATSLASYTYATASTDLTSSWQTVGLADSVVLEGGTTYYFKIAATAVGNNHITQLSNISFTDNGEYSTNADLSTLSVSAGDLTFDADATEYTVYAEMPDSGKITVDAAAEISGVTVEGTGEHTVNYGINDPIVVKVTSRNGKITKTYTINVIITGDSTVSKGCTATLYRGSAPDTAVDVSWWFDGTGKVKSNGGNATGTNYNVTATVIVDLGAEYDLNSMTWERTNQGNSVQGIEIYGSNDPNFAEGSYELLGTTYDTVVNGSGAATHKIMTTALTATDSYRYVKLYKPSKASTTFYPVKMDFYGSAVISSTESDLTETVTVPSKYYAVGDKLIAAAYDTDGRMTAVNFVDAANAASTDIVLTKKNADDTVKVMVWEDFVEVEKRAEVTTLD